MRSPISPYEAQRAGSTPLSGALRFVWMIRVGQQVSIGLLRFVMSDSLPENRCSMAAMLNA
jgi:hypothetical protein